MPPPQHQWQRVEHVAKDSGRLHAGRGRNRSRRNHSITLSRPDKLRIRTENANAKSGLWFCPSRIRWELNCRGATLCQGYVECEGSAVEGVGRERRGDGLPAAKWISELGLWDAGKVLTHTHTHTHTRAHTHTHTRIRDECARELPRWPLASWCEISFAFS